MPSGGCTPPGTWRPHTGDPPDPAHPGAAVGEPPGLGSEPLRLPEPPGLGASGEAEPGSGFPEPRSPSGSGRGVLGRAGRAAAGLGGKVAAGGKEEPPGLDSCTLSAEVSS